MLKLVLQHNKHKTFETNNAKVGITTAQTQNIETNNAKVGITTAQAQNH